MRRPPCAETRNQRWVIWWCHKCTLTAKKPGPFKTASWRVLQVTCKLFLQTCKKVKVNLLTFFFPWHYVKLSEAVVKKCMYKIPLYLWSYCRSSCCVKGKWRRAEETINTVFASLQVNNTAEGRRPAHLHFLRVESYSAVHHIHAPRSQSANISVCQVNKAR